MDYIRHLPQHPLDLPGLQQQQQQSVYQGEQQQQHHLLEYYANFSSSSLAEAAFAAVDPNEVLSKDCSVGNPVVNRDSEPESPGSSSDDSGLCSSSLSSSNNNLSSGSGGTSVGVSGVLPDLDGLEDMEVDDLGGCGGLSISEQVHGVVRPPT